MKRSTNYGDPCLCGNKTEWHPECYAGMPIQSPLREVARVERHTGSLKDMSIIVWIGEQPPEGTILYAFIPKEQTKAQPAPAAGAQDHLAP